MSEHANTSILSGPALEGLEDYHSITDVFHSAVSRFSSKPAFTCMGKTLSFSDLDRLSAHFAAWLQHETDLVPGDRIAIQLPNVLQFPRGSVWCLAGGARGGQHQPAVYRAGDGAPVQRLQCQGHRDLGQYGRQARKSAR